MPSLQKIILAAFAGTFIATALSDGSPMVYVESVLTHLPL